MFAFLCKYLDHIFSEIDLIIFQIKVRGPIGGPNPDLNATVKCRRCGKKFKLNEL